MNEGRLSEEAALLLTHHRLCPDCLGELLEGPHGGLSTNWICSACSAAFNEMGPGGVLGVERIPRRNVCSRCGAHRSHRTRGGPVTWMCVVCSAYVCAFCARRGADGTILYDTLCSDECWITAGRPTE